MPAADADHALSKRDTSATIRRSPVPKTRASKTKSSSSARAAPAARYGFLTVGQTAKILGVSPSTLRLWESEGLIAPQRTSGRYRLYSPELLKVLKRIKYLREVQRLNMPGIRRELKDSPGSTSTSGNGVSVTGSGSGSHASHSHGSSHASASSAGNPTATGTRASASGAKIAAKPDRTLGPQLRRMRERKRY